MWLHSLGRYKEVVLRIVCEPYLGIYVDEWSFHTVDLFVLGIVLFCKNHSIEVISELHCYMLAIYIYIVNSVLDIEKPGNTSGYQFYLTGKIPLISL